MITAFGEAFNNIVAHGYRDRSDGMLDVEADLGPDEITLNLIDNGVEVDFARVNPPDLDSMPEGGMGIFMIYALVDEVTYRGGKVNVLSLTKRTSRSVRSPHKRRSASTTASVPTPVCVITRRASATRWSTFTACGSRIMPCCVRFTEVTSATCGAISPDRNPRSMTPIPPSSASTTAIAARVIVSMLADTMGRLIVRCSENRVLRSIASGSRLGTIPS